jgi:hypothetical protein
MSLIIQYPIMFLWSPPRQKNQLNLLRIRNKCVAANLVAVKKQRCVFDLCAYLFANYLFFLSCSLRLCAKRAAELELNIL